MKLRNRYYFSEVGRTDLADNLALIVGYSGLTPSRKILINTDCDLVKGQILRICGGFGFNLKSVIYGNDEFKSGEKRIALMGGLKIQENCEKYNARITQVLKEHENWFGDLDVVFVLKNGCFTGVFEVNENEKIKLGKSLGVWSINTGLDYGKKEYCFGVL